MKPTFLSVAIGLAATSVSAQDDDLIDYARLFREHAAEVVPGKDYRGVPGEVLNLPDGTTLWRGRPDNVLEYGGTSTVGTACGFLWALIAIDTVRQCPDGIPPDQMALVNRTSDRILTYWGQNSYPPLSLDEMDALLDEPNADRAKYDCSAIKNDFDGPLAQAKIISSTEFQAAIGGELAKPPHLMVMDPCY